MAKDAENGDEEYKEDVENEREKKCRWQL